MLQYPEVVLNAFTLAGQALCPDCQLRGFKVGALKVEVYPLDDPTTTLAFNVLDGEGPFSFDLRYVPDARLKVVGTLISEGAPDTAASIVATQEVIVPREEDQTVPVTLTFTVGATP